MIRYESILAAGLLLILAAPVQAADTPAKPAAAKSAPVKAKKPLAVAKKTPAAYPAEADVAPDPTTLVTQARAASAQGQTDLALRLAQAAIVADPARPSSYDALGDVYAAANQPDFARNYYAEALSIDPTDAGATKAVAALDRAGDTRKADASADGAKPGIP